MTVLSVLQLNCGGSAGVMYDVGQWMCEHSVHLAILQEPWTAYGRVKGLPARIRVYASNGSAFSAIAVNDCGLECLLMEHLTSQWGVCVWVKGDFGEMYVVSVYCKFSDELGPYMEYLGGVLHACGNTPTLIGMDANASSPMWFSKTARTSSNSRGYRRGEELSECFLRNNLHVLNVPSEWYTFEGPVGVSDIDVSLVNDAAMAFDFEWSIDDRWGVSDHRPIMITVRGNRSVEMNETSRGRTWCLRGVDWWVYEARMVEISSSVPLSEFRLKDVDDQVGIIHSWMCSVNDELLRASCKTNPKSVKWWSRSLYLKRRSVRNLRKNFQRARARGGDDVPEHRLAYTRGMKEYKSMLARAKDEDWKNFVCSNSGDPWGQVYKVCRGKYDRHDVSGIRVGDRVCMNWRESVSALLDSFFPEAGRERAPPPSTVSSGTPALTCGGVETAVAGRSLAPLPPTVDSGTPELTSGEVEEAVYRLRSRRSPGWDGMTGEMCKSIWRAIPEHLFCLFECCMREGVFPADWKVARVVVLLKSPDRVRSNPQSYRGISLLPVLGKVLERILISRLETKVSHRMSSRQYGFRPGRNTEDAWNYVKHNVSMSDSRYVLGIFVDFKGAFDYLCWDVVLGKLNECGCQEMALWRSYFSGRRAFVRGVNDEVSKNVERGCPQGSISGPFIWNLMMDDLLDQLQSESKVVAYADDLLILVEGRSRAELETVGTSLMRIVHEWGQKVGVAVSLDKTTMMVLKGPSFARRSPVIRINGVSLRYATSVKYLGIRVGEGMGFAGHFLELKDRLTVMVNALRRVLRRDWGLGRRAVRILYKGLFVACAAYGSSVFADFARSVYGRKLLYACQRVILYACIPVCRTVSTDAMQVLMGVPPLDLEVERRANLFKIRRGLPLLPHDWVTSDDLLSRRPGEILSLLDDCLMRRWQTRWDECQNGRVTFAFLRDVDLAMGILDRSFSLSLGYLLTGHGSLNASLVRFRLSDTASCPMCGAPREDWQHVLCVCPAYADIRNLDAWGVIATANGYDFSACMYSDGVWELINQFACVAFERRRRLQPPQHLAVVRGR